MPPTKSAKKKPATVKTAPAKKAKAATAKAPAPKAAKPAKAPAARMSLAVVMAEMEKAGSEQTRKTYKRHGAVDPMFGVSFATLKVLKKRIGVDHELALALWDTGNFDARNLAVKVVDPELMKSAELDRWAREIPMSRMCGSFVGMVAADGPHAAAKAVQWHDSKKAHERCSGWHLFGQLCQRDETMPDSFFEKRLAGIERAIHAAPNFEREGMNMGVVTIGCRNAALRKLATAAAKRIGPVEIDHGDTACATPDVVEYIDKAWARAKAQGFESPAAHERSRESPRLRC